MKRSLKKRFKIFRRWCTYYLLRLAYGTVKFFPRSFLLAFMAVGAPFAYLLNRRERKRMLENLKLAFPEKSGKFREQIARRVFANIARCAVDIFTALRHGGGEITKRIPMKIDWPSYCAKIMEKGSVVISGHIGCWELLACAASQYTGGRIAVIAKRIYFPPLNRWLESIRNSLKVRIFYQDDSALKVIRFLRRKNTLGILPDQDLKRTTGIFVRFFGREAWTPTGPIAIALAAGVPIIVTYLVWDRGAYRLVTEGPLPLPNTGSREKDIRILTQKWTDILERTIRKYPDQWMWFHRRWRTRPGDSREKDKAAR